MTVGTIYTFDNGKRACKYLCTWVGPAGYDLKRVMWPPKTKAEGIEFPEIISINIGPNTTKEKKK